LRVITRQQGLERETDGSRIGNSSAAMTKRTSSVSAGPTGNPWRRRCAMNPLIRAAAPAITPLADQPGDTWRGTRFRSASVFKFSPLSLYPVLKPLGERQLVGTLAEVGDRGRYQPVIGGGFSWAANMC
jgi:hypothetical protein